MQKISPDQLDPSRSYCNVLPVIPLWQCLSSCHLNVRYLHVAQHAACIDNLKSRFEQNHCRLPRLSAIFLLMTANQRTRFARPGFTLIEMMVVIGVMAILALLALPSYYFRVVRQQIEGIAPLVTIAQTPIAAAWAGTHTLPADNAAAGLPTADKMVNNYVSAILIQDGAINITFGNRATQALSGKILTLRPAIVTDAPIVPVTWVCGNAAAPYNMTVMGVNRTTIAVTYLPLICR